jgi:hypothetical protein
MQYWIEVLLIGLVIGGVIGAIIVVGADTAHPMTSTSPCLGGHVFIQGTYAAGMTYKFIGNFMAGQPRSGVFPNGTAWITVSC